MKRRTFEAERAGKLADQVARGLEFSAAQAKALVEAGAVYLSGRRQRDPDVVVPKGMTVSVVLEESGSSPLVSASRPPLRVLYEDRWLLVVDKPPFVTAQPTPSRRGDSLVDLASEHLGKDAGLVHRLDRETSGVTVFGKTKEATSELAEQFRKRTAKKRYLAVTGPLAPESARIDLPLSPDPSRPGRYRATRAANGAPAVTDLVSLHRAPSFSLVAAYPLTGRTHQIRAHLAAAGAPIAGDTRYGGAKAIDGVPIPRYLLHAQALALTHPGSGKPVLFEAALPEDMAGWFARAQVPPPSGGW